MTRRRILLDEGLDEALARYLPAHEVRSVRQMGWRQFTNGRLLTQAEGEFDILLTTDKGIPYQQNLKGRQIAIVVLRGPNTKLDTLVRLLPEFERLQGGLRPGTSIEIREQL